MELLLSCTPIAPFFCLFGMEQTPCVVTGDLTETPIFQNTHVGAYMFRYTVFQSENTDDVQS